MPLDSPPENAQRESPPLTPALSGKKGQPQGEQDFPKVSPPNLIQQRARIAKQLNDVTRHAFEPLFEQGDYITVSAFKNEYIRDSNGVPLPNYIRLKHDGTLDIAVLKPETHPVECSLMQTLAGLDEEIQTLGSISSE
jgi:hypothetical protein